MKETSTTHKISVNGIEYDYKFCTWKDFEDIERTGYSVKMDYTEYGCVSIEEVIYRILNHKQPKQPLIDWYGQGRNMGD